MVRLGWSVFDLLMVPLAAVIAAFLADRWLGPMQWLVIALMGVVQLGVFFRLGVYRVVLRYSGADVLLNITLGVTAGVIAAVATTYFLYLPNVGVLGRAFLAVYAPLVVGLCGGARIVGRSLLQQRHTTDSRRVLIYGSGALGNLVFSELRGVEAYRVVGFLDDDQMRHGGLIRGVKVFGSLKDLPRLKKELKPDLLVIANSGYSQKYLRQVFQSCMDLGIHVKAVQGMATDRSRHVQIQDLALEDLLRRPPRTYSQENVGAMLKGKLVLVTGAGGSIGSELCRQIAACGPAGMLLVDHSEFNLYQIDSDLHCRHETLPIFPILANLVDRAAVDALLRNHRPHIIFHAAAYKHVPMVEGNPFLGVANNLGGFANLLDAAIAIGVDRLILVSTDKAVRPTNIMGASKRACEMLMQNIEYGSTTLCAVRFGNVLGSSGSVIPRFLEQISRGGPVTVTHPDVTRYFMLLPEAVELVLQAGAVAKHGETLILDMGEPIKIVNLARQLIFMTGHVPDVDIAISFTGLRPGEKLTEELLLDEAESATTIDGITVARPTHRDRAEVRQLVESLLDCCRRRDLDGFITFTKSLVPEWRPSAEFSAIMDGRTDAFPVIAEGEAQESDRRR